MAEKSGKREDFFPAIEKKYGEKITYWLKQVKDLGDAKYPEQIALLRENYGFSQAHANAVVMYVRGSTTSKRHKTLTSYLQTLPAPHRKTINSILDVAQKKRPKLELVMAWNHPMLKWNGEYVFGVSGTKNNVLIAPFDATVLEELEDRLGDYTVLKKTVRVPADWKVNASLINDMIGLAIKRLDPK